MSPFFKLKSVFVYEYSTKTYKTHLTFVLLELKVISSHQYRARPACTYVQSDNVLYYWLTNFKISF